MSHKKRLTVYTNIVYTIIILRFFALQPNVCVDAKNSNMWPKRETFDDHYFIQNFWALLFKV
jgi:hypothetical protein